MAPHNDRVILGRVSDDLRRGRERLNEPRAASDSSRIRIHIAPEQFGAMPSLPAQRLIEAARGLALTRIDLDAALEGETFSIETAGQSSRPFEDEAGIDPSWLNLPSSDRAFIVAALKFDHSEPGLERMFSLADRIEKTDPAKAKVAPARTRLNLLAFGLGVRPEVDLWPKLAGVSACVVGNDDGEPTGAVLALHAIDEPSAQRLATDVLPKLARAAGLKGEGLGTIAERPLAVSVLGKSVVVTWGAVAESPKQDWPLADAPPCRFFLVRPDRIPGLARLGTPLAAGLAALPPIIWEGRQRDGLTFDRLRVVGLKGAVKAFLEALPRQPAPAEFRDTKRPATRSS
jgi:hypothetical protein